MREIFREGTFDFKGAVDLSNRCGITGQGMRYRYQVRLFADSLDGRGFILDNRAINCYWHLVYSNDVPKVLPSCEVMADAGCSDFQRLARMQGVELTGCEIRIFGGTHSAVTTRWGQGIWSQATAVEAHDELEPVYEEIEHGDPIIGQLAWVASDRLATLAAPAFAQEITIHGAA
jgi:hypothetical protein